MKRYISFMLNSLAEIIVQRVIKIGIFLLKEKKGKAFNLEETFVVIKIRLIKFT